MNNKEKFEIKDIVVNLNEKIRAKKFNIIGRESEIEQVITSLSRREKNNPILVGPPGVGKTAIVEGLAKAIVEGSVPKQLVGFEIYEVTMNAIVSGSELVGQMEKKVEDLVKWATDPNNKVIIFIDEFHTVMNAGKHSQVAQALKPPMSRGEIKVIGATTNSEYKILEEDKAFERRVQKIIVNEPTQEDTFTLLREIKNKYEAFHGVNISDDVIKKAIEWTDRYMPNKYQPDKSIDLIDQTSASKGVENFSKGNKIIEFEKKLYELNVKLKSASSSQMTAIKEKMASIRKSIANEELKTKNSEEIVNKISILKQELIKKDFEMNLLKKQSDFFGAANLMDEIHDLRQEISKIEKEKMRRDLSVITVEDLANQLSKRIEIPANKILSNNDVDLWRLQEVISDKIIGQAHAIGSIADSLIVSQAGLRKKRGPIASFLFTGPTGTGKTEVAKQLGEFIFSNKNGIIRIDMSEYSSNYSVSNLIGSPKGYVDSKKGGVLTEAIKNKPYSIILLDEIEKAHESARDLILQVLDDGRLTDSMGDVVDFKNTIIIATTNVVASEEEFSEEDLIKQLTKTMRPEFVNRFSNIVQFRHLTKKDYETILKKELDDFAKELADNNSDIELHYTNDDVSRIVDKIYIKEMGARPINKFVTRELEVYASKIFLKKDGTKIVVSDYLDEIGY